MIQLFTEELFKHHQRRVLEIRKCSTTRHLKILITKVKILTFQNSKLSKQPIFMDYFRIKTMTKKKIKFSKCINWFFASQLISFFISSKMIPSLSFCFSTSKSHKCKDSTNVEFFIKTSVPITELLKIWLTLAISSNTYLIFCRNIIQKITSSWIQTPLSSLMESKTKKMKITTSHQV